MTNLEIIGEIALLTLNNPPDNSLQQPEFIGQSVLHDYLQNNSPKALIIRGTGRHFSAGADLASIRQLSNDGKLAELLNKGKSLLQYIYNMNIPVIAAIEGVCFGGGLEIALHCHIRVVSEKTLMAFPESMHKLMPGLSGNNILREYLTMGKSIEMILSNRIVNAEDAIKEGLADYCCSPKQTFDFALNLAKKMTDGRSHEVINSIMTAIKNAYVLSPQQAMEEETKLFCQLAKNMSNNDN